ncbi:TonB-like protein [Flavobacterium chryseum]|uniref:energy transducer TonB n=1 Tax=Flavobacterium sp. P3160 TaxID=2512113 RepID=UPI00105FC342|nr:energy transducer TonB [Flavobacterium sp. P3160]TDO78175.1 TonB-like protein [Flavobacterium sp. P3160]
MKFILQVFIFLTISTKLFSQTPATIDKVIFLDSSWVETTADDYKYIRVIENYYTDRKSYIFKDYFKSKKLQMIGASSDRDILRQEGQFVYYYENGNKKSTVNYSNYKKKGREFNWYENGNIKSELEYFENKKGEVECKTNNYWNVQNEQKVKDGNGDYEIVNEYQKESGKVKNGLPDGIWSGKILKSKTTFTENYENGKLISGISKDSLNIEYPYTIVSQAPSPKKGINSFYSYVAKSMNIPADVRNKISGKIYLTFIVDKDGTLVEPKIVKGIGYGLDENAIRLIKEAKKWNPGIRRGLPVRVLYSLPITIASNSTF